MEPERDEFSREMERGSRRPDHGPKLATILEYGQRFHLNTLIETGTWQGATVEGARGHFSRVYSVEIVPENHRLAVERFAGDPTVNILFGSSPTVLRNLLPTITEKPLFYLDAHYSNFHTPILEELDVIFELCPDCVIIIDDASDYNGTTTAPGDYPPEIKGCRYPKISELKKLILDRKPTWTFEVKDDLIRAYEK
jgi:hypothetical protein